MSLIPGSSDVQPLKEAWWSPSAYTTCLLKEHNHTG